MKIEMKKKAAVLPLLISLQVHATPLEVLHWWTAAGEAQAQQKLEKALLAKQVEWQNFAVGGEGGDSAIRVLQMRALSGNPPDAAHIKGPDIGQWSKVGVLAEVDDIVDSSLWQEIIPQVVRDSVTFNNHYMAVPVNVHRVNWLWLNKKIFSELKLPIPTTWDSFFLIADRIKEAGYLPLAHGGTVWQDALIFESLALSLLGAEKYKKAFVDHDEAILTSTAMVGVFKKYKRLNRYIDHSLLGKDWFHASQLLANDKAAMQFMGDWAKGMWSATGKVAMVDYICVDVPESRGLYSYNIDSFVLFKKYNSDIQQNAQKIFVETLLDKEFQIDFNLSKGSIPIRNDIDMSLFDACSQKSSADFNSAQLVPSFTQNLATPSHLQNIMAQIISDYFNTPNADAATTVKRLSLAIRALQ